MTNPPYSHKKRKTTHSHTSHHQPQHQSRAAKSHLTHDEIWDDSALVDSWNEALEEYRYYHSLAARGEMVRIGDEGVLGEDELEGEGAEGGADDGGDGGVDGDAGDDPRDALEEGEYNEDERERRDGDGNGGAEAVTREDDHGGGFIAPAKPAAASSAGRGAATPMAAAGGMPHALLGNVSGQDEAMKNVMMSWYYAGYYTGFYEGQRQGGLQGVDRQHAGEDAGKNAGTGSREESGR